MSESKRRFWSSIPGLVTGAAGVLTAVVGLITVLIQLDVIGKDSDNGTDTTVPGSADTRPGATTGPRTGAGGTAPRFSVTPTSLALTAIKKSADVTVTNSGSVPLTLTTKLVGAHPGEFDADDENCSNGDVSPGARCTITVTYDAPVGGNHQARLQVNAEGAAGPSEVALTGRVV